MSHEASTVIETAFRDEGIQLYTDTSLKEISHLDSRFTVAFDQNGQTIKVEAPHLLNALGRRPAIQGLSLEAAGVTTRKTGHIECDEMQRTANPKIYACGDVAGPHEIVHIAIMQGEVAAKHATNRKAAPVHYDDLLGVVFTDPQVGIIGLSEATLKARGLDYLSADYPFDDHGKSILMGAKYGYVRVFAEKKTGIVLGAECVSKDAGELIHSLAVAVTMKASVKDLLKVHWYHPTLSEIWSYPIEDIVDQM
jgi:pyruvate/2-oxoglutarate dehydrogenase complex dihydrolipoamide dehydrogenase (E3) component